MVGRMVEAAAKQPKINLAKLTADALIELARRNIEAYGLICWGVLPAEHHKQWLKYLMNPEVKRLLIIAPPGSAKSTWVSQIWPTFELGRSKANINMAYLIVSNTATQAELFSNTSRMVVESAAYREVFPHVEPDYKAGWGEQEWFVARNGPPRKDPTCAAFGVGGPLVGRRVDLAILDDVCDEENTASQLQRDRIWEWFNKTLLSRLTPDGRVVCVGTRWHEDDLAGRILAREAELKKAGKRGMGWVVVHHRALKADGTSLWPEVWPVEMLERKRNEVGEIEFELVWQGNTSPLKGLYFKRDLMHTFKWSPDSPELRDVAYYMTVDPAISKKEEACRTAIVVTAQRQDRRGPVYVVDARAGHWDLDQTIESIFDVAAAWQPLWLVGVESGAYQKSLVWILREQQARRGQYLPIVELKADADKKRRIKSLIPFIHGGRFVIADHLHELINELLQFDKGKYVDLCDALAYQLQLVATGEYQPASAAPPKKAIPWALQGPSDDWLNAETRKVLGVYGW